MAGAAAVAAFWPEKSPRASSPPVFSGVASWRFSDAGAGSDGSMAGESPLVFGRTGKLGGAARAGAGSGRDFEAGCQAYPFAPAEATAGCGASGAGRDSSNAASSAPSGGTGSASTSSVNGALATGALATGARRERRSRPFCRAPTPKLRCDAASTAAGANKESAAVAEGGRIAAGGAAAADAAAAAGLAASALRSRPRATRKVPLDCSTLIGLASTRLAPRRNARAIAAWPSTSATASEL